MSQPPFRAKGAELESEYFEGEKWCIPFVLPNRSLCVSLLSRSFSRLLFALEAGLERAIQFLRAGLFLDNSEE